MAAEQNGGARNKLLANTREDFSTVISPQTFQKFKSMKRVIDASKSADCQNSNAHGSSSKQGSESGDYVLKVTAEEYDQLKKKYTKNKKFSKQKSVEQQQPSRSKSKSPSSLKSSAKTEEAKKQRKVKEERSPRNSGVGLKQNGRDKQERSPRNSGVGLKQNGKDKQERSPRNSGVGLKQNGKDEQERSPRNSGVGLKQNGKDKQEISPRNSGVGLKQNEKDEQERSPRNSGVGLKQNGKDGPERSPRNSGVGLKQNGKDPLERSPRNSGVGLKQNGKTSQKKNIEHTSLAPKNNPKSENKPASRKSYEVADAKPKIETNDKSRWSVGMVSGKNFDNDDGLLDSSLLKGKQIASNKDSSSGAKLGEPSSADVLENTQEKKGRQRASLTPKSPNEQGKHHKKDSTKNRNSIGKENMNKTSKCSISKDGPTSTSRKENNKGKNGEYSNDNRNEEKLLESENPEHEQDVEVIINQIKQLKIADAAQNDQELTNNLCDTGSQSKSILKTGRKPSVDFENKTILSNNSDLKLNYSVGPKTCEDEKRTSPMDGDELDENEESVMIGVGENSGIKEKLVDFPFVTKRMDESLATDILQPSVDLDGYLENNLDKFGAASVGKDSNDNDSSTTKYQPVPGTSKNSEMNLEENLQASLSSVAMKLVKKTTPAARTPIILKTPKRLKDGEIMSEMLIYKLGSHSTPRKIRKNRNLDSFRKSDWGTPATDRVTSTFLKRKISKKVKGKMFIKKTSQGTLQPLPISKLTSKLNSPRRGQSPKKSAKDESGDETYKVVPVSDLIKKFENLEKVDEPVITQSRVAVTYKRSAIFEKWQNGAKTIQQGLNKLKEVEKKSPALDYSNKETSNEQETNSRNEKQTTPTSNFDSTNNNENFNSLTILNGDCIETMSFVSLKFEQIYSDECNDQTGKNMRFSDLYKEINFQLSDSEKNEASEKTNEEVTKNNNLESSVSTLQDNNNDYDLSSADKTLKSSNNQGQEKAFEEEGTDVLKNLEINQLDCNNVKILDVPSNKSTNDQQIDRSSLVYQKIVSNNSQGQEKVFEEEGTDVLESLESENSVNSKVVEIIREKPNQLTKEENIEEHTKQLIKDEKVEEHFNEPIADKQIIEDSFKQPTKEDKIEENQPTKDEQIAGGFRGFEEVIVAEGRIDTTGEDRASPAYEAGVVDDVTKGEEFGDSFRQQLLNMEADDDDTSISTLLALSRKLSTQPTSYADYRKQFMAVKSRSLPPQQRINNCDSDDPKMSL